MGRKTKQAKRATPMRPLTAKQRPGFAVMDREYGAAHTAADAATARFSKNFQTLLQRALRGTLPESYPYRPHQAHLTLWQEVPVTTARAITDMTAARFVCRGEGT